MITSVGVQGQPSPKKTIYQFKVTNLEGEEFDFSTLKGKKVMIVNTASKCGLTPQYKKLSWAEKFARLLVLKLIPHP